MKLRKIKKDIELNKLGRFLGSIAALSTSEADRAEDIRKYVGLESTRLIGFSVSVIQISPGESDTQMDGEIIGDDFFWLA